MIWGFFPLFLETPRWISKHGWIFSAESLCQGLIPSTARWLTLPGPSHSFPQACRAGGGVIHVRTQSGINRCGHAKLICMHLSNLKKSLGIWLTFGILQELAEFNSDHDMGPTSATLWARVMQPAGTSAKHGKSLHKSGSFCFCWVHERI